MSRAVEILTLQQFEAAGGLADGYAFEEKMKNRESPGTAALIFDL